MVWVMRGRCWGACSSTTLGARFWREPQLIIDILAGDASCPRKHRNIKDSILQCPRPGKNFLKHKSLKTILQWHIPKIFGSLSAPPEHLIHFSFSSSRLLLLAIRCRYACGSKSLIVRYPSVACLECGEARASTCGNSLSPAAIALHIR